MSTLPPSAETEQKIADFLREANPSAAGGKNAILASLDLFTDGWLDSLLQLKLIAFLEQEYSLRLTPFQLTRKSFLSVKAIAALLSGNK